MNETNTMHQRFFTCQSSFTRCGFVLIMLLMFALPASAQVMLMDTRLNQQAIRLQRLDDQAIVYFDAQGNLQARPLSQFVQLIITPPPQGPEPPPEAVSPEAFPEASSDSAADAPDDQPAATQPAQEAQPMQGVLQLIDGQRITGTLLQTLDDGQLLHWQHPQAGTLAIKLDVIKSFAVTGSQASTPPVAAGAVDHLRLANGDALQGYIATITEAGLNFEPQGVNQRVALPWQQVQSFTLANAPAPPGQPAAMIILDDDTTLRVHTLTLEANQVACVPHLAATPGSPAVLPMTSLRRVVFANDSVRLVELASLPWKVEAGGSVFAAPLPVRVSQGQMHLHAPLTLSFELPGGTQAVTAQAVLDVSPDDPALPWADVAVSLRDAASPEADAATRSSPGASEQDQSAATAALSAERMRATLHMRLDATGRRVLLVLDPALNGPIMDRVKITNAWVAVER